MRYGVMMSREFKCAKCEWQDINIQLKDHISHAWHDERCKEFLACQCKRCGHYWTENPSDKKEVVNE